MIGQIFGKLKVIAAAESYKFHTRKGKMGSRAMWLCVCECSGQIIASGTKLRNGKIFQCAGCGYRSRPQSTVRLSGIERLYNLSIVSRCKRTKILNKLTLDQFAELVSKPCYYCGDSPRFISHLSGDNRYASKIELYANGVDRVDSNLNYEISNCVPCCSSCNVAKSVLSQTDFLLKIKKIYDKHLRNSELDDKYYILREELKDNE